MAIKYYNYDPSMAAAVIFTVIFILTSIFHAYQIVKNRMWFFIAFLVGSLFEVIGYACRAIGANQSPNWSKGPYVMQALLLLLGPTCYAASIYMILGRLIRLLEAESYSLIRTRWLTKFFLMGDILSIALQGFGGGKLANADTSDEVTTGEHIIIGGLIVQVIFFGLFMTVTCLFHLKINKNPTPRSYNVGVNWRRFIYVLYTTSFLILVRSVFRLVEYIMGRESVLQTHEAYLYAFDATLMAAASVLMNFFHPSKYLIAPRKNIDDREVSMQLRSSDGEPTV